MRAGCRFVVETIDSVREYTMRTGRPSFHAASATNGCTERSSFEPNPPPTAVGIMRTFSGANSQNLRDVVAVHVRRLRARLNLDVIADAPREAGLRFDVGVLDESRLVLALDHEVRCGERFFHVAANHAPAHQNISSRCS